MPTINLLFSIALGIFASVVVKALGLDINNSVIVGCVCSLLVTINGSAVFLKK